MPGLQTHHRWGSRNALLAPIGKFHRPERAGDGLGGRGKGKFHGGSITCWQDRNSMPNPNAAMLSTDFGAQPAMPTHAFSTDN
jgi:hypothetical protein